MSHDQTHASADASGHDAHQAAAGGIIPESSLEDKFLVLLAGLALVGLIYCGFEWANKMPPLDSTPADHQPHAYH